MTVSLSWNTANYQYLLTAVTGVAQRLENYVTRQYKSDNEIFGAKHLGDLATQMAIPPAIEKLCWMFNLSSFERNILLMGVGMAINPNFPALCANAHRNPQMAYPTFSLALEIFPDAHWSAFTPQAPLRRWQLLQVGTGAVLPLCPLQIDESILHWLLGECYQDSYLINLCQSIPVEKVALPPSHQQIATQIAKVFGVDNLFEFPAVQLCGSQITASYEIVKAACEMRGIPLKAMSVRRLPIDADKLDTFVQRWRRETLFTGSILLLDCDRVNLANLELQTAILQFMENMSNRLVITATERLPPSRRSLINFDVGSLTHQEQIKLWEFHLGTVATQFNGQVNQLVAQFNLSPAAIQATCHQFKIQNSNPNQLWDLCRIQARPHLDNLAQRIDSSATWEDLVIPQRQRQTLEEIAAHLRQRPKVYQEWGFADKSRRGLGLSALFSGQSGTGKTMAAEVLAKELHLDLYRIDLSAVVSKYIGETEKNLRRIFDVAETGGAILLFDEADALFGKRTQVKDSHDRHANVEVSYLLQRMEAYQGLAILTTNLKESLDSAFLRRIRFLVPFPFPDEASRTEIWRRVFPAQTPTEGLDFKKLGKLNIAGGNIRNIAINAAILAADASESVMMKHILQAVQSEYLKLERPLTDTEIKGWV